MAAQSMQQAGGEGHAGGILKPLCEGKTRGITHQDFAWNGRYRLIACAINVCMILGVYLEYLWAAEWPEIPAQCDTRGSLPWLEWCACFNRYTFSHAMLRGHNLELFGVVGGVVALLFTSVEHRRVTHLQSLLHEHLKNISTVDATSSKEGTGAQDAVSATQTTLRFLQAYSLLVKIAFLSTLLLVPFHLERPMMHFVSAGLASGFMVTGICIYAAMPLGFTTGAYCKHSGGYLHFLAQRHNALRQKALLVVALHIILPLTLAVHHAAWTDMTGRIFGACEVLAILSYQIFIASFAGDEFAARGS